MGGSVGQQQAHVLVGKPGGELRPDVAVARRLQLALVVRRDDRETVQRIQQHAPVQAGREPVADALGDDRHGRGHDAVDHQLDGRALAGRPDMDGLLADRVQDRLCPRHVGRLAADQHHQLARLGFGGAAGHRRVQDGDALRGTGLGQPSRRVRGHRARVDHQTAGPQAGQQAGVAVGRCLERGIVGHRDQDDVGGLGERPRRAMQRAAIVGALTLGARRVGGDRVAGVAHMLRHALGHRAIADEADGALLFRHG